MLDGDTNVPGLGDPRRKACRKRVRRSLIFRVKSVASRIEYRQSLTPGLDADAGCAKLTLSRRPHTPEDVLRNRRIDPPRCAAPAARYTGFPGSVYLTLLFFFAVWLR